MKIHQIPFKETNYFSNLICDYLDENPNLTEFYGNFPNIEGFKNQIDLKKTFPSKNRIVLVEALKNQYQNTQITVATKNNIQLLEDKNTFTITTGHQLNIFTGPLYFLYKIVSTINLTKQLKTQFPSYNFVPVYWMATEDHDFEEINYFNFKGNKISWSAESKGAVGRLETAGFKQVYDEFLKLLDNSNNAKNIKKLFQEAYLAHDNLTDATRYLVNELFGQNGLVIIDGDDKLLKSIFAPIVKDELLNNTSYKNVIKTNELLQKSYKIQVNPREINLFYLVEGLRERIIFEDNIYKVNNTEIVFEEEEILDELKNHPKRFSPNVIMRPVYQETILPNLCYIGGGGELAYWFQLKAYFNAINTPFPILLLRNSVLLMSKKQAAKLDKLTISVPELFYNQINLIDKKVKEISTIDIDFSAQKLFLQQQFEALKELAKNTEASFLGAVNAQEKKQLNGLAVLEKRLLKAQKRKLADAVERIKFIQDQLFPKQSLEERTRNFSEIYLELGDSLIPMLMEALDPLQMKFTIIEYE
ncbi:bacillithiol biosynthesis cysteine-adding enzyme BshC [Lutibacter sp. HS1-25]|uniref:bacillithiol biosynthesis cysteine-adding enzyme BshC n=1 Tax=Lutibacter sp. HS1-25 TaxID=2485000 RepID=UPI00101330BE|nr:bacillithiol biosynthesis cysteine-adding enzyme BshC [Lutibacter sp. HS1-25]RXP55127.1 bacillithiol biosynthesis cysteine-adding enzyme BshC [Lutibacter sp. HS1-25]